MSEVKTNKLTASTGTAITLGDSGDTFTVPSGATLTVASGGTITNSGTATGFAGGLASVQTFTSSGTWTRPTGITKVIMEIQAGGGGSGCGDWPYNRGGAGGGGGYVKKFLDVSSISSSTITVGSGGAGGVTGGDGGTSSWADGTNTLTGGGGEGGGPSSANSANGEAGSGGSATGGDINIGGGDGDWWSANPSANQSGMIMSVGGSSFLGIGGVGNTGGQYTPNGVEGKGYGAGATGSKYPGYDNPGVDGTDGIILVWEYA
jgi:hypothetical protein